MRRIETILIDAGETPMGTFTMGTNPPRKIIKARVVRASDWQRLMAVVRAVDDADTQFPFKQDAPCKAMAVLRTHLDKRGRF